MSPGIWLYQNSQRMTTADRLRIWKTMHKFMDLHCKSLVCSRCLRCPRHSRTRKRIYLSNYDRSFNIYVWEAIKWWQGMSQFQEYYKVSLPRANTKFKSHYDDDVGYLWVSDDKWYNSDWLSSFGELSNLNLGEFQKFSNTRANASLYVNRILYTMILYSSII